MRKIVHVDMDAFYASVEQRDRPEFRGKPVVVAWQGERSVVCAASYEARKYGIRSALPALRAARLCPDAIFIKPDFDKYRAVSKQIRAIFRRHTDLVEPLSLDEAYLDVTIEKTGLPTATETAKKIRQEIREETELTASAGVAPNKFLAKIASDWKKPDGLFVIKPSQVEAFLTPLPVGRIPGVGKVTEEQLHRDGIMTVGDLREVELEVLSQRYGKFGARLWELARGIDDHPVFEEREPKSISVENTFSTDVDIDAVVKYLVDASEEVWRSVTKRELTGRTVTVKLRRGDFTTLTRRTTPPVPPHDARELADVALSLVEKFPFDSNTHYRLAGVGLSNFFPAIGEEPDDQQRLF